MRKKILKTKSEAKFTRFYPAEMPWQKALSVVTIGNTKYRIAGWGPDPAYSNYQSLRKANTLVDKWNELVIG